MRVDCRLAPLVLIDDVGVNTLADYDMAKFFSYYKNSDVKELASYTQPDTYSTILAGIVKLAKPYVTRQHASFGTK